MLESCRAATLQSLPLIRSAQNADARAAEALKACTDGLASWREDWKDALGLNAKRPKTIRPDRERMGKARADLQARIDRALAELTASRSRRAEVEARMADLRRPL
jgi:chromosome segregation ATPase